MPEKPVKILKYFTFKRIAIPILLGLGVAFFMLFRNLNIQAFRDIEWIWQTFFWIFLALCLMAIRDLAYMYRIRLLTDKQLSWRRSFVVIMLWEFSSSITPSVVGGSAIALYVINKEGIHMGRTTAVVMVTALLDELFYILTVPIIILWAGYENIFISNADFVFFNSKFGSLGIFLIGYVFIIMLTSIIIYGVFINPRAVKWLLIKAFKLPVLRKWLYQAIDTGDQVITTSMELKGKPATFWIKAYTATLFSWTARYWVVNCMILAFTATDEHLLIYARQLVMWVILLISPTPGGSGVAEFVFNDFLGEFITTGLVPAMAILWRLLSFYPYIFIGAIILPGWIKRAYHK